METLFASGRIVDGILLLVAAEALALAWLGRRRGLRLPALLATLASGAALMLALRAALVGAGWIAVAGWLLVGLFAHGLDLVLRFRGGHGTTPQRTAARNNAANGRVHARHLIKTTPRSVRERSP